MWNGLKAYTIQYENSKISTAKPQNVVNNEHNKNRKLNLIETKTQNINVAMIPQAHTKCNNKSAHIRF